MTPIERWQAYNEAQWTLIPPDGERCPAPIGGIHGRCVLLNGHEGLHESQTITGLNFIPKDWKPER